MVFDISQAKDIYAGMVVFGYFDTVHMGHKALIEGAKTAANGDIISVFLFKNDIFGILGCKKAPLYSFESRVKMLLDLGVDNIFYIDADREFLNLTPNEFVSYIKKHLIVSGVACGSDFTFGKKGAGKATDLFNSFPQSKHYECSLLTMFGEKVSTSGIKILLEEGKVEQVSKLLGRNFAINGKILPGRHVGRRLGFPTANIFCDINIKEGVYFSTTCINGTKYKSITSIGPHPTFDDASKNVETYLLDFNANIYGENAIVELLHYARELVKFETIEDLKLQISLDEDRRRKYD